MRIAFFCAKCIPIHANTLKERPLGGTETAVIRLAEELSKRNHEVIVFTSLKDPPLSNPKYIHFSEALKHGEFDILVLLKEWLPAFYGIKAKKIFYWTGDSPDQYVNFGIGDKRVIGVISKFLAVSNWHAKTFCQGTGFPLEKAAVIGNGVHWPYYEDKEERNYKRLIYTSAPYRGLGLLPPIYRKIKNEITDLELHVYSGLKLYDTEKPFEGPQSAESDKILSDISKLDDCTVHGNVTQEKLASELKKSALFIYPNIVFETCCISVLEAQAAGCIPLTSGFGALPESVGNGGFIIRGLPGTEDFDNACVSQAIALLRDRNKFEAVSTQAISRIQDNYTWSKVAERFLLICQG